MAHEQQRKFCLSIKNIFPKHFINTNVLDCGSLDINGNNRHLFSECEYIGIDIVNGKNVDIVCLLHKAVENGIIDKEKYGTVISTEMLEHDLHYGSSLKAMVDVLRPNGLLLFTCATTGRKPHGTTGCRPEDSPLTNSYYKNLTEDDIRSVLDIDVLFTNYEFKTNLDPNDLYFWGIKR